MPPFRDKAKLYYECHITLEPVYDRRLEIADRTVSYHGFRMADPLMQKRKEDTPERSAKDTFCTARDKSYRNLEARMYECVWDLQYAGFQVWRYKIEDTLLDVRHPPIMEEFPRPRRTLLEYIAGKF